MVHYVPKSCNSLMVVLGIYASYSQTDWLVPGLLPLLLVCVCVHACVRERERKRGTLKLDVRAYKQIWVGMKDCKENPTWQCFPDVLDRNLFIIYTHTQP